MNKRVFFTVASTLFLSLQFTFIASAGADTDQWKAHDYNHNSTSQTDAASCLLKQLTFNGDEKILDVGSGDGKITAAIAKKLSKGHVTGIDLSPSMIDFAKITYPEEVYLNLKFILKDAQNLSYHEEFDQVLSFTSLQWVHSHAAFLEGAYDGLKPDGILAITMPLGLPPSLEQAANEIITSPQWSLYFQEFTTGWNFVEKDEYNDLLIAHGFNPTRVAVVPQKDVFASRQVFEKFLSQWFPYLRPLPQTLTKIFMNRVIDRYLELEKPFPNGEVHFKIRRLEVIATKN